MGAYTSQLYLTSKNSKCLVKKLKIVLSKNKKKKERNDILHDAGQISQGERLAVLSLIPLLKPKSSADRTAPERQQTTSPSGAP